MQFTKIQLKKPYILQTVIIKSGSIFLVAFDNRVQEKGKISKCKSTSNFAYFKDNIKLIYINTIIFFIKIECLSSVGYFKYFKTDIA